MSTELRITESPIPGLFVVILPVHGDSRGWFKENWQNEKLTELGFPNFKPVQNNISYNDKIGTTRGIHAEPWDKYVSVATGKVFGAWVDLREGNSFGQVFTIEIDPSIAVFVPRGVGNAYQTLEANTSYSYLVNAHWTSDAKYTFLNLADETANIKWPISLKGAEISEKDLEHPNLKDVMPFQTKKTVILGANGQLGRSLQIEFPEAIALTRSQFDLADIKTWNSIDWSNVETVINAAAYTKVDDAETTEGRKLAWAINATGVGNLAKKCQENDITLVHFSSDYVFDGTKDSPYTENDPVSPLGVYGQTKAAGDLAVSLGEKYFLIRTSWVIGDGRNFVQSVVQRLKESETTLIVNDQQGRLTFAADLAAFTKLLIREKRAFGIYNLSSDGDATSWFDLGLFIHEITPESLGEPKSISSSEYSDSVATSTKRQATRPKNSMLSIQKTIDTGFVPKSWKIGLEEYILGSTNDSL